MTPTKRELSTREILDPIRERLANGVRRIDPKSPEGLRIAEQLKRDEEVKRTLCKGYDTRCLARTPHDEWAPLPCSVDVPESLSAKAQRANAKRWGR